MLTNSIHCIMVDYAGKGIYWMGQEYLMVFLNEVTNEEKGEHYYRVI
jgi:hypothetical protein